MTDKTDAQEPTEPTDKAEDNGAPYRTTTLGELGARMPIGIEVGGKLEKAFGHRKWRFKEEKLLGEIKEENKGMTIGEFVTHVFGLMMTDVGPHNFNGKMSDIEKRLTVTQCYLGDVLYMYAWLRKGCMGKDVDSVLRCSLCSHENQRRLDLDDLDVRVLEDPAKIIQRVELEDGLAIFGELRTAVDVRPPRWHVMENPDMIGTENDAKRTEVLFKECICGAEGIDPGTPIAIADDDLDEMTKVDIERVTAAIEDTPGPQMVIELQCTRCRQTSAQVIDYRYDAFFSMSSPSQRVGPT
jgi:hypothetical protein